MKYRVSAKFNPYHDPKNGQFTSADHSVDSPDQLLSYMHTLASVKYHPNIANLRVAGQAIFHPERSLGLKREEMPQIPTANRADFLNSMRTQLVDIDPRKLSPTQAEIDGHKTAVFMKQAMENTDVFRPPIVSRDGYVIDGHHNWASRVVQAVANPSANIMMPAHLVDMKRDALLARAHAYASAHNFEAKPIHKWNIFHKPAGTPDGGEFTNAEGAGATGSDTNAPDGKRVIAFDPSDDAMYEFEHMFGPFHSDAYGSGRLRFIENQAAHDFNSKVWAEQQKFLLKHPKVMQDVVAYQGTDYGALNDYLRTGKPEDPRTGMVMPESMAKSMAARLDRVIDEEAPAIPNGSVLYRAFRSDRVMERAANGDLEGKVFQDKAFLSTTANPYTMGKFYEDKPDKSNAVLMRITTHDDIRGIYTPAAWPSKSHFPGEYEVLLNRSTPLYIDKVTRLKTGGLVVDASVYGHAPSRGIKFNPNHDPSNGQFTSGPAGNADYTGPGSAANPFPGKPGGGWPSGVHSPEPALHDPDGDGQGDFSFRPPNSTKPGEPYDFQDLYTETENPNAVHNKLVEEAMAYRQSLRGGKEMALNVYQGSGYRAMNAFAANMGDNYSYDQHTIDAVEKAYGPHNMDELKDEVKNIDEALDNSPALPDNVTLFRAFRSKELVGRAEGLVGQTFRDGRFLSTTANGERAYTWIDEKLYSHDAVVMKLTTQNAHGLYLTGGPADQYAWEHEVLFDRNTPIHITNVRPLMNYGEKVGIMVEGTIGHG